MIPVTTFRGRTVAVFGMARSGLAAALALRAGGADVACWDDGEKGREAAAKAGLPLVDLREAEWPQFAVLVLTPGVPLTHPKPHWTVERARVAGVPVVGDTWLFFRELALLPEADRAKVIGITGTNGKSTTTALTAHLLREAGKRVAMGGNIGEAVLGLAAFSEVDVYVLELSSYQIDLTWRPEGQDGLGAIDPGIGCDVGILLNVSPDHLDRHGDMEHYAEIKERLVSNAATAIVGVDDAESRIIALRRLASCRPLVALHVRHDPSRKVAVTKNDLFPFADLLFQPDSRDRRTTKLMGTHNDQNRFAASAAAVALGAEKEALYAYVATFPGLAHRMEDLGLGFGVRFVNDSKATNADSAAKALCSYQDVFWIAGGRPKEGGIEELAPYFSRVRRAFLIGEATEGFAVTLRNHGVEFEKCGTLDVAVEKAFFDALASNASEKTVLFSPACASFDQFKDFENRGDMFKKFVSKLTTNTPNTQLLNPP